MPINKRQIPGDKVNDPSLIEALTFNNPAGSRKSSEVGRHLLPLGDGAGAFTTDASTIRVLANQGKNLAIYNNDTVVHAVTLGEANTQAALAAGATDATGHVGIPCTPNAWTYVACAGSNYVITDSNKLLVFLIDDDTFIRQEASK